MSGKATPTRNTVFISYGHQDSAYARALAEDLRGRGIDAWMDDRIDFGDRWWRKIVSRLRACSAFVVVMTPEAEESEWVEREVHLALREKKPIIPLCLQGEGFALLITIQYVNVRDGRLPPPRFYRLLDTALGRPAEPEIAEPVERPARSEAVESSASAKRRGIRAIPRLVTEHPMYPQEREERAGIERPAALSKRQAFEPEMVLIPAGTFLMGSDPGKDERARDNEQPQHRLYLPDFYIARTPVTNLEYRAFVKATGWTSPTDWRNEMPSGDKVRHPVVNVTWRDALAYCRWLSDVSGRAYAVPSEAQWEKAASWDAARGRKRIYPWGDEWDPRRCNTAEGGPRDTTPVGSYLDGASAYGVLDMAGNVWEWTRSVESKDRSGSTYAYPYSPDDGREDVDAPGDALRIVRGGSFLDPPSNARCTYRLGNKPVTRYRRLGFRVALASAS
jgi:formylglycine-generating enzyme required for sulfatase activity